MAIARMGMRFSWLVLIISLVSLTLACGQEAGEEHADAEQGEVQPKPEGAVQVDVKLGEWAIIPSQAEVQSGQVYFLADNIGPNDPHEMVIVKTDLAPDQLPNVDGKVDEDQVEVIGEIEEFAVGSKSSGAFNLDAGNYVLICNIVEDINGESESHYLNGMRTAFTVK